jgi:ADP-heptose:LPS heptosyltransferase
MNLHTFDTDFDESHGRFMDTAAVIANLDVVVCVDTSIIHLAGALGKPVLTILPPACDCRWYTQDTTTPWYPTMKLFRQKKIGQTADIMEQIKGELLKYRK